MDKKYIEHLGMSSHVDEGLWDTLKARATGYTQAGKNLLGKSVGETEGAKFGVIFKSFVAKAVQTIMDLGTVLSPYEQSGKLSDPQKEELLKFHAAKLALLKVAKAKLSEANLFTRPFKLLGAIATGNPDTIIAAYRKQILDQWEVFVKDAKKLNIVPDQYIFRKIAAFAPAVPEALEKLGGALGKSLISAVPSSPQGIQFQPTTPAANATSSPVVPAAAVKPETNPVAASPAPPPIPMPQAVSHPQKQFTVNSDSGAAIAVDLIVQSWIKIADQLLSKSMGEAIEEPEKLPVKGKEQEPSDDDEPVGKLVTKIKGEVRRDASKAEVVLEPTPPVEHVFKDRTKSVMFHLRYAFVKDNSEHAFDYFAESYQRDPSSNKAKLLQKDNGWSHVLLFDAFDVVDANSGAANYSFDMMKNLQKADPEMYQKVQEGMKITGPITGYNELNKKVTDGLYNLLQGIQPRNWRGERNLTVDPSKVLSGAHGLTPPLVGNPETSTTLEPEDKPARPSQKARATQIAEPPLGEPEKPKTTGKVVSKAKQKKAGTAPLGKKSATKKATETNPPIEPPKMTPEQYRDYLIKKKELKGTEDAIKKGFGEAFNPPMKDFFS
jgi:hypothetical protein